MSVECEFQNRHLASRDGTRIYYVHHCDLYQRGPLVVLALATRKTTTLGDNVGMWTFELSADGKWLAFIGDLGRSPDPDCTYQGNLYVAEATGKSIRLAMDKAAAVVTVLTAGSFLVRRYLDCTTGSTKPARCDAAAATAAPLDCITGHPSAVSPDRSLILDVREGKDLSSTKLVAVRPDCSSETMLADDYYERISQVTDLSPIFSASGKYVVYTTGQPGKKNLGLKVVPTNGGNSTALDTAADLYFSFKASPFAEELVLVKNEWTEIDILSLTLPESMELIFKTGEGRRLDSVELVHGGELVLFVDQSKLYRDGSASLASVLYSRGVLLG